MDRAGLPWIFIALTLLVAPAAGAERLSFADAAIGTLPRDFATALTGQGKPGTWSVVEDASAEGGRALAQLDPDPTDYRFPLAIYAPVFPSDIEVTVRFKPISGKEDQAGGVIVRLIDPDNYYLARANALEHNVHFFRVVRGRRQQLAGANARVANGVWHTLTLRAAGNRFTVSFNGRVLFSHSDRTFGKPGKVALWTKPTASRTSTGSRSSRQRRNRTMPYFGAKAGSYVDIFMDCIRWRSVERGYEELSHV